ncbi:MORN-repeat protein, partial [Orpheovirus IHUMI-LCC2]
LRNENGNIEIICNYKEGKLHGKYEKWYISGEICKRGFYKNDKRDGLFFNYQGFGGLFTTKEYKDGTTIYV